MTAQTLKPEQRAYMNVARRSFVIFCWLYAGGVAFQVFCIGMVLLAGQGEWLETHRTVGHLIGFAAILSLVSGIVARLSWQLLVATGGLVLLHGLQYAFIGAAGGVVGAGLSRGERCALVLACGSPRTKRLRLACKEVSVTFALFALLLVAFATFFNTGLQYYTTISTYPLFSHVDEKNFVAFHKAYERKLPLSIYVPYSLLMLGTLLLAFIRPEGVALLWVIVLLVLNGSIMAVSLAFAAPVHTKLDREGKHPDDLAKLRRFNLPRLLGPATE